MARTIMKSFASTCICITKERSILISSIGSRFRYDSDEYPVPKSSIDRPTPTLDSASSTAIDRPESPIRKPSVSSMRRNAGRHVVLAQQPWDLIGEVLVEQATEARR